MISHFFIHGIEEAKKTAVKNFIIKIINIIMIFTFVKDVNDLPIYVFSIAFFSFLGNFSMWMQLKSYLVKINIKNLNPFQYFKPALQLFIPAIAVQVFAVVDKSMIGWLTHNFAENGYYEQALKIVDMALALITVMGSMMIPRIAKENSQGHNNEVQRYINKTFKFTLMIAIPMTLGIISISNKFVPIFFGEQYIKATGILNILSLLFIFMGLNSVTGTQYLISTGQQNVHTKYLLLGGLINVVLNAILIPKFMSIGAAIASVIGEFAITIFELRFLYKTGQYNIKEILKNITNYLMAGLIMFLTAIGLMHFVNNLIGILVVISISCVIYFAFLLIIKDDLITEEINNILRKGKIK